MTDNYFDWLIERKHKIEKVNDDFIKKIFLKIHDEYAENYIIMRKEEKK